MKVVIGSDHGGFTLKETIKQSLEAAGYEVMDFGPQDAKSVDYPDYGEAVGEAVASGEAAYGVAICTTGIGISMAANKVRGVRAAVCRNEDAAEFCRRHNDANVICLGQKYDTPYLAAKMTKIFLETPFEGGRHERRVRQLAAIEAKGL